MSPLLSVSDTSIVFVDPRRRHLGSLRATLDHTFTDALRLIASAASTAAVSRYFVTDPAVDDDWLVQPDGGRIHFVGNSGPSWSNSGLAAELKASSRSNLVICGFWLETKVSFLALCALSSGFDVFLASDATPARAPHTREAASARLMQSGVVPTTTPQLLAEWAEESANAALRTNLHSLLASAQNM